jgi:hypothetical protein
MKELLLLGFSSEKLPFLKTLLHDFNLINNDLQLLKIPSESKYHGILVGKDLNEITTIKIPIYYLGPSDLTNPEIFDHLFLTDSIHFEKLVFEIGAAWVHLIPELSYGELDHSSRLAQRNYARLQTFQLNNLFKNVSIRPRDGRSSTKMIQTAKELLRKYDLDPTRSKKITAKLLFELTGSPDSEIFPNLDRSIKTNPRQITKTIENLLLNWKEEHPINLQYYNQDSLSGVHRAGWKYVLDHCKSLHDSKGIICDTFLERTFLWGRWILAEEGLIPYTVPWIGFVHHGTNQDYSENNVVKLFETPEFLQSLFTCQGIFTLSNHLQKYFQAKLREKEFELPVFSLVHPTLFVDNTWNPKILNEVQLNLVTIGAWYRNPYTIYEIKVPSHVKKWALKGKRMDSYFRPSKLHLNSTQIYQETPSPHIWKRYFIERLRKLQVTYAELDGKKVFPGKLEKELNSVEIIEHLPDNKYDKLLANSVIFLNLVDASAVNTIIECIVRETPIIVNPLPAVVEYLGKSYPLYYKGISSIKELLTKEKLHRAHLYLKKKSKENLQITTFLSDLKKSLKSIQSFRKDEYSNYSHERLAISDHKTESSC